MARLTLHAVQITIAHQTSSYTNWLSILVVLIFIPFAALRVMAESLGETELHMAKLMPAYSACVLHSLRVLVQGTF